MDTSLALTKAVMCAGENHFRFSRLFVVGLWGSLLLSIVLGAPRRCLAAEAGWPERFQYRMVLLRNTSLATDAKLETAKQQLQRAAITGYNCAILAASANLIQPQIAGDDYLARLESLRDEANRQGIGLVPSVMPFDSDAQISQFDPHLAEGLPVRDALYVVEGAEAHLRPDSPVTLVNSSFETVGQNGIPGWQLEGLHAGRSIKVDSSQALYGNSSLRLTNVAEKTGRVSYRAIQKVRLPPFRLFRASVWIRSDDADVQGRAYLVARIGDRDLGLDSFRPPKGREWGRHDLFFNSLQGGDTEIWLMVSDGSSGAHTIWFDNLEIEQLGLANMLRRPDCPVVVRNERGRAYEEGRDFEIVDGQVITSSPVGSPNDNTPRLTLTRNTRISDGERLRVNFYSRICSRPLSLCTSSAQVYDFFVAGIDPLRNTLAPFGYHLATKYITTANWDDTCQRTKKTPGAQWGESLQRQIEILSGNGSRPVCFVWSDIYQPWADPYSGFWIRNGTFEDAWKHLPKDCVVMNAHHNAEESKSPRFFSANGYRQIIAGDTEVGEWMQANGEIPGIVGVLNIDAPLDEFAAMAWGWLPQEVRAKLPPAPTRKVTRHGRPRADSTREPTTQSASPPEIRTWTDASGQFTIEAAFIRAKSSIVTLRKRDGSEITIPFKTLSDQDRRWLIREVGKK